MSKDAPEEEINQQLSLCNDCQVDYEKVDIAREDFNQVLKEKHGFFAEVSPKLIALISFVGVFLVIFIALAIFSCVRKIRNSI